MRRIFTVEQANRTLPYVRRIVEDIVRTYERWQDRVRDFEMVAAAPAAVASPRAEALQRDVQGLAADIERYSAELEQVGAHIKGYDTGLVDFPAEVEGRPVYLCWRLGEPAVQHWHEVDAGFAGRRPLPLRPRAESRPTR